MDRGNGFSQACDAPSADVMQNGPNDTVWWSGMFSGHWLWWLERQEWVSLADIRDL
jgi:hypothetical protein